MKKIVFLFLSFLIVHIKSQIVFCPPGAQWSYNFFWSAGGAPGLQQEVLEKITYTHDSILGTDVVKVLRNNEFYLQCGAVWNASTTLIKQKGDTVLFRNAATNQSWQILYNFNVVAGDNWQTDVKGNAGNLADPTTISYTILVDSVKYVVENGFSLKRLYVRYEHYDSWSTLKSEPAIITERFGCDGFLFNYYNSSEGGCDGDWFQRNLCYKDTQFGIKQFTNYPCDYKNLTEIGELQQGNGFLNVYPNPVKDKLSFEYTTIAENIKLNITNALGQIVYSKNDFDLLEELDLNFLKTGIYYLKIEDDKRHNVFKVVKE